VEGLGLYTVMQQGQDGDFMRNGSHVVFLLEEAVKYRSKLFVFQMMQSSHFPPLDLSLQ